MLEAQVEALKSGTTAAEEAVLFERLPRDAPVGKDYVAYRFGCTMRAVVRGEAGTGAIRRISKKPLKFIKREVDEAWRKHTKTPKEKAADAIANAKPRRRLSVIKKSEATV